MQLLSALDTILRNSLWLYSFKEKESVSYRFAHSLWEVDALWFLVSLKLRASF